MSCPGLRGSFSVIWYEQTCLADVTGPGWLLLPRGGHQDDGEGLAVFGLHHNLKIQVLHVLTALVWLGWREKYENLVIVWNKSSWGLLWFDLWSDLLPQHGNISGDWCFSKAGKGRDLLLASNVNPLFFYRYFMVCLRLNQEFDTYTHHLCPLVPLSVCSRWATQLHSVIQRQTTVRHALRIYQIINSGRTKTVITVRISFLNFPKDQEQ